MIPNNAFPPRGRSTARGVPGKSYWPKSPGQTPPSNPWRHAPGRRDDTHPHQPTDPTRLRVATGSAARFGPEGAARVTAAAGRSTVPP